MVYVILISGCSAMFCRILHSDKPPLDIGTTYWSLRDSVIQCELFLARALQFHFAVDHPHKVSH